VWLAKVVVAVVVCVVCIACTLSTVIILLFNVSGKHQKIKINAANQSK